MVPTIRNPRLPGIRPRARTRAHPRDDVRRMLAMLRSVSTCSLAIALAWAAPARCADEIHWTLVGPTTVTFDWRGSETAMRYGLTSTYGQSATAATPNPVPFSSPGPFQEARLTGLVANTVYHYSIGTGADHTFRTPPPRGSSGFTVCAEADIGDASSYAQVSGVQSLIAGAKPALVLAAGDLTYGNANGQSTVDRHFNDVMVWSQDAAYMPVWGNHEWDVPAADDMRNYKGRFELPNPQTSPGSPAVSCCGEDWSWFDYGNARFISYPEPFTSATWTDWNTQATALMDQAQADPAIKFIVTFGHRPAYSSGHHPGDPTIQGYLDALGDAHNKYVLNLNGHSHDYERSFPQHGVVHLTVGTGGASLEQDGACLWATCAPPAWSAFRAMRHGATVLRFTDTGIQGQFLCGPAGGGTDDVTCTPGSVVDAFTIAAASSGYTTLVTDPNLVFSEPNVPRPGYLVPITDPVFHTQVTRIAGGIGLSTAPVAGTWGADARHVYSKQQPWSSDGTMIVIENRGGGGPSPLFLDGTTYSPKFGPCGNDPLYDYRWHPSRTHAHEMINVDGSGNELMWFDVVSCTKTRSWTLPITSNYGIGSGEGNPSNDGRFVAVASATQMVIVDMDPQPPFAAYPNQRIGPVRDISDCGLGSCAIDWVSVSASGQYAVVNYDGDYPRVFDIDPQTLALTPHAYPASTPECLSHGPANGFVLDLGHADFALNPFDGNADVLIGQRSSGCPEIVNGAPMAGVVMVRLRDGFVTMLTDPSNEAFPHHISTRDLDRPGWVYVSYYPSPGQRYNDEIVAIKMDGTQTVERVAHLHSNISGCYRCEPHAVPSRDGQRVIFASNWATFCGSGCSASTDIKDYVVGFQVGPITPTLLSLVSAQAEPDRVRLIWFAADGLALPARVYRRAVDGDWQVLGQVWADGTGRISYEDTQVAAGARYGYRLGVMQGGVEELLGETWVDVPRATGFALAGLRPNPAVQELTVAFTLPDESPARLELMDLAGRRLVAREVGTLGPGSHVVNLKEGRAFPPGVYLLRLTRGSRSLMARAIIMQ